MHLYTKETFLALKKNLHVGRQMMTARGCRRRESMDLSCSVTQIDCRLRRCYCELWYPAEKNRTWLKNELVITRICIFYIFYFFIHHSCCKWVLYKSFPSVIFMSSEKKFECNKKQQYNWPPMFTVDLSPDLTEVNIRNVSFFVSRYLEDWLDSNTLIPSHHGDTNTQLDWGQASLGQLGLGPLASPSSKE